MTKKAHYPSKDVESFLLSIMESYEYRGYCTAKGEEQNDLRMYCI
jgi:hypothetical protein